MSPLGLWKKLLLMKFAAVIKLGDIMNTRKEEKEVIKGGLKSLEIGGGNN